MKESLKRNYIMMKEMVDEEIEYLPYVLGTRPNNNKINLEQYISIAKKMGLKRIEEIHHFDNIDISVFSAEHAKKNENVISYNSGKGLEKNQAQMSAVMEFIERKSATEHQPTRINMSYYDLDKDLAIEPASLSTHFAEYVSNSNTINWFPVIRLNDGKNFLCPTIAVLFDYYDDVPLFYNNSNGLASGLNFSSAIVQGIYEVVERDGLSAAFATKNYYDLDMNTVDGNICKELINQFNYNGIEVNIKYVKNEFDMPCFIVTGNDKKQKSSLFLCGGFGCHSDKEIALLRAMTELEQTRRVIYENKREDIKYMRPNHNDKMDYDRILRKNKDWYSYDKNKSISFSDITSKQFKTVAEELSWQIEQLKKSNYEIFVANLSSKGIDSIPVVRVIIPGLENWYHDTERIGKRLFKTIHTSKRSIQVSEK